MTLIDARKLWMCDTTFYFVVETGIDIERIPYCNISKFFCRKDAKDAFIEKLKSYVAWEDEEEDDEEYDDPDDAPLSFEKTYEEEIRNGKFIDYEDNYLLQIKEV